jgi:hypothetical protein
LLKAILRWRTTFDHLDADGVHLNAIPVAILSVEESLENLPFNLNIACAEDFAYPLDEQF